MKLISGIEHVGIAARDSAALRDWYVRHLGCEVVFDDGKEQPMCFLKMLDGRSMYEIYPYNADSPAEDNKLRGIRHIAITCAVADFDAAVQYFTDLNVEVVSPAGWNAQGAGNFFFRDPEGNILQLVARPKPL